jgi:hypothetical protein
VRTVRPVDVCNCAFTSFSICVHAKLAIVAIRLITGNATEVANSDMSHGVRVGVKRFDLLWRIFLPFLVGDGGKV